MARPRTHNLDVPNLYSKLDKRTDRVYYQYKDKRTGQHYGLGSDKKRAVAVATELNNRIQEQLVDHYSNLLNQNRDFIRERGVTVQSFCTQYMNAIGKKFEKGELSRNSFTQKRKATSLLVKQCKGLGMKEVTVRDIVAILSPYTDAGKDSMAKLMRSQISDIFQEAQHLGEVAAGYNPAKATRTPKVTVSRARLTEDEFLLVAESTKEHSPAYVYRALILALTTGLRLEDIATMQFSQIKDGHLFVELSKSGGKTKLAFPLALKNPLLDLNLGEILMMCRQTKVLSKYVIHATERKSRVKMGSAISGNTISNHFKKARDKTNLSWPSDATPPSFHEIRSLAERTYKKMGYNTQELLGHKSQQMTDRYHDLRGAQYTYIEITG